MADLPNINTANVGIIAFWNAEDHKTAGVVDPTDCTGVFTNYDVYDNGLDGYKTLGSGRHFNCRVKNDGWCVAWIDRTNTFDYPNKLAADFGESGYKGYYDILWDWFTPTANISSTLTTLSYIISLFEAALETSGDFTFTAADVGHFCHEFTNTNVLTVSDHQGSQAGVITGYVQYTTGTTLYYVSVTGSGGGAIKFAGNSLIASADYKYAAADILAENWIPDPLTDYSLQHWGTSTRDNAILILWS